MFWKESFLSTACSEICGNIQKIRYCINGSWRDAVILKSESDGGSHIFTAEIPSDESGVITAIRLVGSDNSILGERTENIGKSAGYSFVFKVTVTAREGVNK